MKIPTRTPLLFVFCMACLPLYSQSLATNLLFEHANTVYKGRVERIQYSDSGESGDNYAIWTRGEKPYKGHMPDQPICIGTYRFYEMDTLIQGDTLVDGFQVAVGKTYVFFVQQLREQTTAFSTEPVDPSIEAIPFSEALDAELEGFDDMSYVATNHYGPISFKLLCQASPVAARGMVSHISKQKDGYLVAITLASGKQWQVKMPDLNCVSANGRIQQGQYYLFFLTPVAKNRYQLMDRYLGVFQWYAKWHYYLNDKHYKN